MTLPGFFYLVGKTADMSVRAGHEMTRGMPHTVAPKVWPPQNIAPRHYESPFGPNYRMHPELTRSGSAYLMSQISIPLFVGVVTAIAVGHEMENTMLIAESRNIPTADKIRFMQGSVPY